MKRYEFRMAKVLRVRQIQEEAARAGVAAARAAEQRAQAELAASQEHYAGLVTTDGARSAMAFRGLRDQASHRATAVSLARGNRAIAETATAEAVATWHTSNRRVDALERLDERRRDDYDVELRRAEDAAVDDLVVARARSGA